jgi:WD40 repeat protein
LADSTSGSEQRASVSVPDHHLLACIGRGSYGEVWLARNVMGTYRAVKIVYRAAFEHARPFEREFNGIQKFEPISRSHDGFVDVLQIGRTDDYFYYVMELADDVVTGQQIDPATYEPKTLRSQVQGRKPLRFEQCVELGLSLTAALSHLHGHGLIHRDIKPSNIIFVNGIPKLADIGLVAEQSEAKSFVGTEGFIPPEGPGTPQADIYSLGKVLYEIATGKDRHEFPTLPTLLGDSATDAHLLELNTVFLKACQTDTKARYQKATQMRDDLLLLQSGRSVKRAQAVEKRLLLVTRAGVIALLGAAIAVLGVYWISRLAKREAALRQEARRNLYASQMVLAFQALDQGHFGRVRELLNQWRPAGGVAFRGWEWRYLFSQTREDALITLRGHANGVTVLALFPDGRRLASASKDGTVRLWDLERRQTLAILPQSQSEFVSAMALSPDGHVLATGCDDGTFRLWNVDTKETFYVVTNRALNGLRFSPDGKLLATADQQSYRLFNVETRQVVDVLSASPDEFKAEMAFSADGQTLAVGQRDGEVLLWNVAEHRKEFVLSPSEMPQALERSIVAVSFSPDGRSLAASGIDGLRVWNLASRQCVARMTNFSFWTGSAAFSPDGAKLAVAQADQVVRLYDTTDWHELAALRGHTFEIWWVLFTSDGQRIITAGKEGDIKVWSANPQVAAPCVLSFAGQPSQARIGTSQLPAGQPASPILLTALYSDGETVLAIDADHMFSELNMTTFAFGQRSAWPSENTEVLTALLASLRSAQRGSVNSSLVARDILRRRQRVDLSSQISPESLVAGSSGGRWVAAKNNAGTIDLWNLDLTNRVGSFHRLSSSMTALNVSSDGQTVAAGYFNGTLQIWHAATAGAVTIPMAHQDPIQAIAFSPDNRLMATTSYDPYVKLWSVPNHRELARLGGQMFVFTSVAFSPDQKRLAAGGGDGTVTLWDLSSQAPQEVARLKGHNESVSAVAFKNDGDTLVSLSADQLRVWRAAAWSDIP